MTRREAADMLNKKYPKAKIQENQIDIDECYDANDNIIMQITVWNKDSSKDFFEMDGTYVGHKDY